MLSRSGSFSSTRRIQPSGSELTAASSAEKLQALSGWLVRNESGILRLARPPNTKCFPPRPYGRRPIAEYLLAPKTGSSRPFRTFVRRQRRGYHTSINLQPTVTPIRKSGFVSLKMSLDRELRGPTKHVVSASKNGALGRKHGPKTGPV